MVQLAESLFSKVFFSARVVSNTGRKNLNVETVVLFAKRVRDFSLAYATVFLSETKTTEAAEELAER